MTLAEYRAQVSPSEQSEDPAEEVKEAEPSVTKRLKSGYET